MFIALTSAKSELDFTKKKTYNSQKWSTNKEFPKENIGKGWEDGYTISSITYGNGVWAVNMSKGTGYYEQIWRTRKLYPKGCDGTITNPITA